MQNTGMAAIAGYLAPMPQCPLCAGKSWRKIYDLGLLKVQKCTQCAMIFMDPFLSPEGMKKIFSSPELLGSVNQFLADYGNSATWETPRTLAIYRQVIRKITEDRLGGPGKILDIGCGMGTFLKCAVERGWKSFGLEPNCANREKLRTKHGIEVFEDDFFTGTIPEKDFDAVALWDLIEHVPNPEAWVRRCGSFLKPGGVLIIATPNHFSLLDFLADLAYRLTGGHFTYPLKKLYTMDHTLFFTHKTLGRLLLKEGFSIEHRVKVNTDLARYPAGPFFRVFAEILLGAAGLLGLQNRVIVLAKNLAGRPAIKL